MNHMEWEPVDLNELEIIERRELERRQRLLEWIDFLPRLSAELVKKPPMCEFNPGFPCSKFERCCKEHKDYKREVQKHETD